MYENNSGSGEAKKELGTNFFFYWLRDGKKISNFSPHWFFWKQKRLKKPSLDNYWLFLGLFIVLPCIETYQKVDLRTITLDVPPQEVSKRGIPTNQLPRFVFIFFVIFSCARFFKCSKVFSSLVSQMFSFFIIYVG